MSAQSEIVAKRLWLIPAVALLLALATINRWLPDPLASYHAEQAQLMNDEDEVVCLKFADTSDRMKKCMAEIAVLRQRDRNGGPFY